MLLVEDNFITGIISIVVNFVVFGQHMRRDRFGLGAGLLQDALHLLVILQTLEMNILKKVTL